MQLNHASDSMKKTITHWIEAMRLRTLPVSLAGVVTATALALAVGKFKPVVAILCFIFATLAQIASNFANEYFDFRDGLDRRGREGPRRGVTEGDITPHAMLIATCAALALACAVGCSLLFYGPWWILPAGILIAIGVMAYSTGPYPLSRHGLGEIAVIFFFGIVPVNLTFFLQTNYFSGFAFIASLSIGLLGANVLIVNNYRDYSDDKSVGKRTLAVILGKRAMPPLYLCNGIIAMVLLCLLYPVIGFKIIIIALLGTNVNTLLFLQLRKRNGAALTPILGMTAIFMAIISLLLLI